MDNNFKNGFIKYGLDHGYIKPPKKEKKQGEYSEAEQHLQATNWKYYLKACIKTGLESPIPYKVIPYKNGIGIKKIEFFKPIKNGSL